MRPRTQWPNTALRCWVGSLMLHALICWTLFWKQVFIVLSGYKSCFVTIQQIMTWWVWWWAQTNKKFWQKQTFVQEPQPYWGHMVEDHGNVGTTDLLLDLSIKDSPWQLQIGSFIVFLWFSELIMMSTSATISVNLNVKQLRNVFSDSRGEISKVTLNDVIKGDRSPK